MPPLLDSPVSEEIVRALARAGFACFFIEGFVGVVVASATPFVTVVVCAAQVWLVRRAVSTRGR